MDISYRHGEGPKSGQEALKSLIGRWEARLGDSVDQPHLQASITIAQKIQQQLKHLTDARRLSLPEVESIRVRIESYATGLVTSGAPLEGEAYMETLSADLVVQVMAQQIVILGLLERERSRR